MRDGRFLIRLYWACGIFVVALTAGTLIALRTNRHDAPKVVSVDSHVPNDRLQVASEETGKASLQTHEANPVTGQPAVATAIALKDGFRIRLTKLSSHTRPCPFLKSAVTSQFSEADLPSLYEALTNDGLAWQWKDIIFAICVLESDAKALQMTQDFISTPWDWQSSSYRGRSPQTVMRDLVMSISKVAAIDSSLSGPVLTDLFTRKGAETFLTRWREPASSLEDGFLERLTYDLMYGAAYGLLHTRSPELFKVVEERYAEIRAVPGAERSEEERVIMEVCTDLMYLRDIYKERGWEEGIRYYYSLSGEDAVSLKFAAMTKYPWSLE